MLNFFSQVDNLDDFQNFEIVWKKQISALYVSTMLKDVFEPRHDKTNKMTVCPVKTQISLSIRPV